MLRRILRRFFVGLRGVVPQFTGQDSIEAALAVR